jgi:hypothetical protein
MQADPILSAWMSLDGRRHIVTVGRHHPPLHDELTVVLHTLHHTHRSEAFLPRSLSEKDLASLIRQVLEAGVRGLGRRVLCFAKSKRSKKKIEAAFRRDPVISQAVVDQFGVERGAAHEVVTRVLRSGDSRSVDVDADLIIIFGSGLPNSSSEPPVLGTLNMASSELKLERHALARDNRTREIVQSSARTAALRGSRGALSIHGLKAPDRPRRLHHRSLQAESRYRSDLKDQKGGKVIIRQIPVLAAMVDEVLSAQVLWPSRDQLLEWDGHGRSSNRKRVQAIVEKGAGSLRPTEPLAGGRQAWGRFLKMAPLAGRGDKGDARTTGDVRDRKSRRG